MQKGLCFETFFPEFRRLMAISPSSPSLTLSFQFFLYIYDWVCCCAEVRPGCRTSHLSRREFLPFLCVLVYLEQHPNSF